jgi:uncharacterized membrane protein (UPF0182 family)
MDGQYPSPPLFLRRLAFPVSVLIALFVGWLGADRWELALKALNPTPFGVRDPLFDQDVAFYVFRLPLGESEREPASKGPSSRSSGTPR